METKGLLIVHTGDGKGKTTAALGLALRAWGGGAKVLIVQFIKGGQNCGELDALAKISSLPGLGKIVLRRLGLGFVSKNPTQRDAHEKAAREALAAAQAALSEDWDMIILDEINYAVKFGLIGKEEFLALLASRSPEMHLVLTGRDALPEVIDRADLVTEMRAVKHPFTQGIKAQKWVEF